MDTTDVVNIEVDYFLCICGRKIVHHYESFITCEKCHQTYELEISELYHLKSYIMPTSRNHRDQEEYIKITRRGWKPKNGQRDTKEDTTKLH